MRLKKSEKFHFLYIFSLDIFVTGRIFENFNNGTNGCKLPESKKPGKGAGKYVRQVGLLGTIPILLAVGPVIGFLIGRWLDKKLHTDPYLMIAFLIFGFIASGKEVWKIIKQAEKDTDEK